MSRERAKASRVATTMFASTQEKIARKTTTCRTSAADGTEVALEDVDERVLRLAEQIGRRRAGSRSGTRRSSATLAAIETRLARIIASRRDRAAGRCVSSARSAAPSQPMKQYIGSSAASTNPYQSGLWVVRCGRDEDVEAGAWWKKTPTPSSRSSAATTEPTISKTTPDVVHRADRLDADDVDDRRQPTMANVASRTMSPCVGDLQMSPANTVASATAVAAVPAMNASSAV